MEAPGTTYENDAYSVVLAFKWLNYMLSCNGVVRVLCDHRNLLFTFNPTAIEVALGRRTVMKERRLYLYFSAFEYTKQRVPGAANVCVELVTRWMRWYRQLNAIKRIDPSLSLGEAHAIPNNKELQWRSVSEISTSHRVTNYELPNVETLLTAGK